MSEHRKLASAIADDVLMSRGCVEFELEAMASDGIPLPTWKDAVSLASIGASQGLSADWWAKEWRRLNSPRAGDTLADETIEPLPEDEDTAVIEVD